MDNIIKFLFVIIGIIFTLYIPGYLLIETFFGSLEKIVKFPLYILTSLLVSTYSIYILSLLIGFSKVSILIVFIFFAVWLCIFSLKNKIRFGFPKKHLAPLILAIISFFLFLVALIPAIFSFHNDYIVMSAENWQDTAMHMSITESISQGNFPPKAPYFSGAPLSYYYFADFHASIIETLTGSFLPKVFAYINPFFIFLFVLSVYAFAFTLTKNRKMSLFSSILASFYGNFMFLNFLKNLAEGGTIQKLLETKGYTIDFGGILGVSPMADYFLQNRPMMIGLPAFTIILTLLIIGFKRKNIKIFFLVGLIASLFVKFQLFIILASIGVFPLFVLIFGVGKLKLKEIIISSLLFFIGLIPGFLFIYLLKAGNNSTSDLINAVFNYKPWAFDKSISWKLLFIAGNFGIQITLSIVAFILILLRKIKLNRNIIFLFTVFLFLFVIPFIIRFTIYDGDMFKFFYLSVIPLSVIASYPLYKIWENRKIGKSFVTLVLIISIFTSLLNLGQSYFNKNMAYSLAEYNAGLWVRSNTPQKSVFMEIPKVHSAVADIGGRLRVMSYSNWPYSHGYNSGLDNVFIRSIDIKSFYSNPNSEIIRKYNINFVYLGAGEKHDFPLAQKLLNSAPFLVKIYDKENIEIYKVSF